MWTKNHLKIFQNWSTIRTIVSMKMRRMMTKTVGGSIFAVLLDSAPDSHGLLLQSRSGSFEPSHLPFRFSHSSMG